MPVGERAIGVLDPFGAWRGAARLGIRVIRDAVGRAAVATVDAALASGRTGEVVDHILASPIAERAVREALEGPLADAATRALVRGEVLERVTAELLATEVLD